MKRGCLIVVIAVPVLLAIGLYIAYSRVSNSFGLSPAPQVSHETVATPETRLRLVIEREKLVPFLHSFLPKEGVQMPWYASFLVKDPIEEILPFEVALLGGSDYKNNDYDLTFFVNERILGPAFVGFAKPFLEQQERKFKTEKSPAAQLFNTIHWQKDYVKNETRGSLLMSAGLPLPAGMQNRVLRTWPVDKAASKELAQGGNLVEGVLDNTGGDLMTLIGTIGKMNGVSLDQTLSSPEIEKAVKAIDTIRLTANLTGDDELTVIVRTALNTDEFMIRAPFQAISNAVIDGSSMLENLMYMGKRTVTPDQAAFKGLKIIMAKYGVTADYKGGEKPVFDGKTLVASYVFSGFRPLIQQQLDQALQQLAAMQK